MILKGGGQQTPTDPTPQPRTFLQTYPLSYAASLLSNPAVRRPIAPAFFFTSTSPETRSMTVPSSSPCSRIPCISTDDNSNRPDVPRPILPDVASITLFNGDFKSGIDEMDEVVKYLSTYATHPHSK